MPTAESTALLVVLVSGSTSELLLPTATAAADRIAEPTAAASSSRSCGRVQMTTSAAPLPLPIASTRRAYCRVHRPARRPCERQQQRFPSCSLPLPLPIASPSPPPCRLLSPPPCSSPERSTPNRHYFPLRLGPGDSRAACIKTRGAALHLVLRCRPQQPCIGIVRLRSRRGSACLS